METKVYSKSDILQKLAQDGFFVDYLTLNSFLEKYKIEAIFEDEDGSEFFDKSAYDILVKNVLKKTPSFESQTIKSQEVENAQQSVENPISSATVLNQQQNIQQSEQYQQTFADDISIQSDNNESCPPVDTKNKKDKGSLLENIKWYRWDDVSADLSNSVQSDDTEIIDSENTNFDNQNANQVEAKNIADFSANAENHEMLTQQNYWNSQSSEPHSNAIDFDESHNVSSHINEEINNAISANDDNEDDFDDIGLLSDSLQAQEKFQSYIVNELAKKNIDVTPPKTDNAFKFDISEKTLNMIARAIAKKIAKQVSAVLSNDERNSVKLVQAEQKSKILEEQVATLEEQNKKLKLLLVESNKNLNSYKPTFFGLYRFVRKKNKKR